MTIYAFIIYGSKITIRENLFWICPDESFIVNLTAFVDREYCNISPNTPEHSHSLFIEG